MRIFVAGATGVIGTRLIPLLVAQGHEVMGMARSAERAAIVESAGASFVACDVFDFDRLAEAIVGFAPDLLMHQLTDLPERSEEIPAFAERNNRIRTEGTHNLIAAARAVGSVRLLAQSIAWTPPSASGAIAKHGAMVLGVGGVVVRYGQLYGPGTYHSVPPPPPRIHVDDAARRTIPLVDAPSGVVVVVEGPEG